MSVHNLILFPKDEHHRLESYDAMLKFLREIGLIGDDSRYQYPHEFEQGFAFFSLIRFCTHHMVVQLVPDEKGGLKQTPPRESHQFCSICFEPEREKPGLIVSILTQEAKCPKCGHVEETGLDLVVEWSRAHGAGEPFKYRCPDCAREWSMNELDWQHTFGIAWYQIEIQGVHENEAVPSETLLLHLRDFTGVEWDYCFYHM